MDEYAVKFAVGNILVWHNVPCYLILSVMLQDPMNLGFTCKVLNLRTQKKIHKITIVPEAWEVWKPDDK